MACPALYPQAQVPDPHPLHRRRCGRYEPKTWEEGKRRTRTPQMPGKSQREDQDKKTEEGEREKATGPNKARQRSQKERKPEKRRGGH